MVELSHFDKEREISRWLTHPLVKNCRQEAISRWLPEARIIEKKAGGRFLREGDRSKDVFFLTRGSVAIFHHGVAKQRLLVKILLAPAMFGEAECFLNQHWRETVEAIEPSVCVAVPWSSISQVLIKDGAATYAWMKDVVHRHLMTSELVRASILGNVEQRLADLILEYARAFGKHSENGALELRYFPSQENLARLTGLSKKSVQRAMEKYQMDGMLKRELKKIFVTDVVQLSKRGSPAKQKTLVHSAAGQYAYL